MVNTTTDSVRIVLFDAKNKDSFLILSESDDPTNIKLPGGKFDSISETPDHAAKRELREELGLDPANVEIHEARMLLNDDGTSKRYIYWGICDKTFILPSSEINHIEWITIDTIPQCKNISHIRSAVLSCITTITTQEM